jgi:predicted nuclease of predicted toxin-antitoxin system
VKGILADVNVIGYVEHLVRQMQTERWIDFWKALGLTLLHFADVGLTATSPDLQIWRTCQAEQLILITDNRNHDSADSLEAAIRQHNTPESLPVFTIGDLDKFSSDRVYFERVLETLYDYLMRIDTVRGVGRLYLP